MRRSLTKTLNSGVMRIFLHRLTRGITSEAFINFNKRIRKAQNYLRLRYYRDKKRNEQNAQNS